MIGEAGELEEAAALAAGRERLIPSERKSVSARAAYEATAVASYAGVASVGQIQTAGLTTEQSVYHILRADPREAQRDGSCVDEDIQREPNRPNELRDTPCPGALGDRAG